MISHLRGSVTTAPRNSTYMFGATRTPAEDGHRAHGVTQAHGQPWWTWQESNLRLPGASRVLSQLSYKPALRVSGRAITPTGMSRNPTRVSLTGRAGLLQEFPFPGAGRDGRGLNPLHMPSGIRLTDSSIPKFTGFLQVPVMGDQPPGRFRYQAAKSSPNSISPGQGPLSGTEDWGVLAGFNPASQGWWDEQDLNLQPPACKAGTLPLSYHPALL